jgi:uroporphyrinogen-III synthase
MKALRIHQPLPSRLKFAAIGSATAASAQDFLGINARAIPQIHDSESLSVLLGHCTGQRMLLPQADIARPELSENLKRAGAIVSPVMAYQTLKGTGGIRLLDYVQRRQIDVVTFASPSSVHFFKERLLDEGGNMRELSAACIACINAVTQKAAAEAGFDVKLVAKNHTVDSLIHALKDHFSV